MTGPATPLRDPPRAASSAAESGKGRPGVGGGSCGAARGAEVDLQNTGGSDGKELPIAR